jgi:16S rRNA (uracil1498-N3)-methyltransferase
LRAKITLGQAIPKGKNMELIVQKATELGAAGIVPLLSERTVVALGAEEASKKQEKWQRTAVEACKQSGQNWLPEVSLPQTVEKFISSGPSADLLLIASLQPASRGIKEILAEATELAGGDRPASALVLIGPEGDFTPSETNQALTAGFLPLTLGPIVLRTETAAIYSLSVLAHELQS